MRIADDVDEDTARLIAEAGTDLPGVEVVVEARRNYTDGPLMSQLLGYTGPVTAEQIGDLKKLGYLPDDLLGKTGLEATYETELRGTYGSESVERNASGRRIQVLQQIRDAQPGRLPDAHDRHEGPARRAEGPQVGDEARSGSSAARSSP